MAKKKSNGNANDESMQGYFRPLFEENPKLLDTRSNDEMMRRWAADHPGEEASARVKGALSNLKSVLRSKGRKGKAKKAAKAQVSAPLTSNAAPRPTNIKSKLEVLEEQIDDCLTYARNLDRTELHDIINHLRRARNGVVWKMGQ